MNLQIFIIVGGKLDFRSYNISIVSLVNLLIGNDE